MNSESGCHPRLPVRRGPMELIAATAGCAGSPSESVQPLQQVVG
ncbi:hypothetical protein [Kamptonema formosum]|nr:hypothetical protein [Oscillatoria sp. PCC 10802]